MIDEKEKLRELIKKIDDYYDNITEAKFIKDLINLGVDADKVLEENGIEEELQNGGNKVPILIPKKKKRPGNKRFLNYNRQKGTTGKRR